MSAKKVIVLKEGRAIMANGEKARIFTSKGKARNFILNLMIVSTKKHLTWADFEMIEV